MVRIFALIFAAVAVSAAADSVIPKAMKKVSEATRYVHSRDFDTIPGSVITTWYRDGRPDWKKPSVETNVVTIVTGKKVFNPLEDEVQPLRRMREAKKNAWKKDAKNLENGIKVIEKLQNKSSNSMYELFETVLDILREEQSK